MKLAIVQVRCMAGVDKRILDTIKMLSLSKKNQCSIVEDTPSVRGMLKKASGYVTWGPLSAEAEVALKKNGEKKTFALNPPKKGYGRRGIKVQFKAGGALGNRGDKINELLSRMM